MECSNSSVVVAAGSLVSLDNSLSSSVRKDILDTLLFSQLYASGKAAKLDDPETWWSEHNNAMRNTKWLILDQQFRSFNLTIAGCPNVPELLKMLWHESLSRVAVSSIGDILREDAAIPLNDEGVSVLSSHILKAPDAEQKDVDPCSQALSLVVQLAHLAADGTLYSLDLSCKATVAANPDPALAPAATANHRVSTEVQAVFLQRRWDSSAYSSVRGFVQAFLSGKRDGLVVPVPAICTGPSERLQDE